MSSDLQKVFFFLGVYCILFYMSISSSADASPVVEGGGFINDGDVEDDKMTPELEEILKLRRRYDCPMCDSSVFSYCSDKLLHDACCCASSYDNKYPPQCDLADCSFLHANSCQEHKLITRCCCNNLAYAGNTPVES